MIKKRDRIPCGKTIDVNGKSTAGNYLKNINPSLKGTPPRRVSNTEEEIRADERRKMHEYHKGQCKGLTLHCLEHPELRCYACDKCLKEAYAKGASALSERFEKWHNETRNLLVENIERAEEYNDEIRAKYYKGNLDTLNASLQMVQRLAALKAAQVKE